MTDGPWIRIAGRRVGGGAPAYVIAELSGNHGGDFARALRLVEAAAAAGADAVKLQTYTADTLTIDADAPCFRIGGGTSWDGRTLHSLYAEAATPWEWQPRLKAAAGALGMHCFSSPFDESAVAFLEEMNVPAFKIASFELADLPLVRRAARSGRPLILSTGMASLAEIEAAVRSAREGGADGVALLKCTSAYPAAPASMHLRTIPHLAAAFGVPVGLSDHTLGVGVPVAAVTLGAALVEKHLTLRRADGGPDAAFSLEPAEFAAMVRAVREAEAALGGVHYGPTDGERPSRVFRRSLFVVADVAAGAPLTAANVRSIRPGDGLPPKHLPAVIGRRAARDLRRGTPLRWEHLAGASPPNATRDGA